MDELKVFELYSGIGGMHFALKETGLPATVVRSVDINPQANAVYRLNFPNTHLLEKNVQSISDVDFTKLQINMIMMSPPCQPFTRNGLRRDIDDPRNFSVLYIINLLPKLNGVKFILLENVLGFEYSVVRNKLISTLIGSGFVYQEFLLSPDQFSIPNSRLRYYLLAKRIPLHFCFTVKNGIMSDLPVLKEDVAEKIDELNFKYKEIISVGDYFALNNVSDSEDNSSLKIADHTLEKYGSLLDVVSSMSTSTCCFTKAYGRYVEGTGSVFTPTSLYDVKNIFNELETLEKGSKTYMDLMKSLKLRYFSPKEVASLMCFPNYLQFPSHFTNRQRYKLLGNSINVHVVAILTLILVS